MHIRAALLCALALSAAAAAAQGISDLRILLADPESARRLLARDDEYTAALSPYDMSAALKTLKDVSIEEYKEYVGSQTREWTDAERAKLRSVIETEGPALEPYDLKLPKVIHLIKTTGADLGRRAYCRGLDAIVLPQSWLDLDAASLGDVLIHQIFHLALRADPARRQKLYALIGFRKVAALEYPERFLPLKISNPDSPSNDYAFAADYGGRESLFIPILQAKTKYNGGELFSYLSVSFLAVEEVEGKTIPWMGEGRIIQLPLAKVPGFTEATGALAPFLPQPEELMAENFVLLVRGTEGIPQARILEGMSEILGKH